MYVWFNTRTAELVGADIEFLQVREVADGLRDGACTWAREFLCMSGSTRTVERATAQVELRDVVAELADVAWQREARVVVIEANLAALGLHADNLERQLTCAIASQNARLLN